MVVEVTKAILLQAINDNDIIFLDFYAVWCGPCIQFKKTFENNANIYSDKAFFGQVNVDEQRDLAIEYKISSIPTIICLKKGKPCWAHTGTLSEEEFKSKIDILIK